MSDPASWDYLQLIHGAYQAGKDEAYAEEDAHWERIFAWCWDGRAQVEERRWGSGGREHYGEPREGDYRGGPVPWEPEEKEAGQLARAGTHILARTGPAGKMSCRPARRTSRLPPPPTSRASAIGSLKGSRYRKPGCLRQKPGKLNRKNWRQNNA